MVGNIVRGRGNGFWQDWCFVKFWGGYPRGDYSERSFSRWDDKITMDMVH